MSSPTMSEQYVVPDTVRFLVQKERERIIACMNDSPASGSYKDAVEQYLAWQGQLKELEAFMSYFGVSYY